MAIRCILCSRENIGINAYYGFNAKTQDGNRVNDYYRADLNFKF